MKQIGGCLILIIVTLIIGLALSALLALPITWALNTFTPWHPTYLTVLVVLVIVSVVFGGGGRAASK